MERPRNQWTGFEGSPGQTPVAEIRKTPGLPPATGLPRILSWSAPQGLHRARNWPVEACRIERGESCDPPHPSMPVLQYLHPGVRVFHQGFSRARHRPAAGDDDLNSRSFKICPLSPQPSLHSIRRNHRGPASLTPQAHAPSQRLKTRRKSRAEFLGPALNPVTADPLSPSGFAR